MAAVADQAPSARRARWPVRSSRGGLLGGLTGFLLLAAGLALLFWSARQPLAPPTIALIAVGAGLVGTATALLLAAIGFFRMAYELHPDKLVIQAGGRVESIPLDEIEGIYAGGRVGSVRRVRGIHWPGYYVGLVRTRALGPIRIYCTDLATDALSVIATASRTVVLSPDDPAAFRRELILRIERSQDFRSAPTHPSETGFRLPHPLAAGSFVAATALLAALAWSLSAGYGALPDLVGLQLDPTGRPATLVPRPDVLVLPILGGLVLLANLFLAVLVRRSGAAAAALLGATCAVVQAIILLAGLRILAA